MASDRHMEAAEAVYWSVVDLEPFTRRSIEAIAAALALAEREGMERAAEIANEHARELNRNLDRHCARSCEFVATAILSQAGEIA